MTANFFDANFYRAANSDLAKFSDQQALSHFQTYGLQEGRAFSPFVNLNFYRASNSDLANLSNSQLLDHAQTYGVKEGRKLSPFVDLDFYLAKNADLSKAFGSDSEALSPKGDREKALQHLQTFGLKEDRKFSQFANLDYYLANNADVNKATGGDVTKALQHLEIYGANEGRKYSEYFDPSFYLKNNADVNTTFKGDSFKALQHFETFGVNEGRSGSAVFNTSYYKKYYNDLGSLSNKTAYDHFQVYGLNEGRRGSQAFDVTAYLRKNTDLQAVKYNNQQAIDHYLQYGQQEGRTATNRNAIIFVADGLRPDAVNATDTPTLFALRQQGVNFTNSHSLFPTFTTPNASAIATGHYLGDTGAFSNTIYPGFAVPSANNSVTSFIENDPILADIDEKFPGNNFLDEESILAAARLSGFGTAAIGKLGPVLIQDVTQGNRVNGAVPPSQTIIIDDSTGTTAGVPLNSDITARLTAAGLTPPTGGVSSLRVQPSGNNTTPGTLSANVAQQQYFADATSKAVIPLLKDKNQPFAMVYWSRDPDGTQHNNGDSLNTLNPGINGPTVRAAVKNTDNNLKQILDSLQALGIADDTDVFVTADHGFGTISKHEIDSTGTNFTKSYAASLSYPNINGVGLKVNAGFLPSGFVAIDIANALGQSLYDPDRATKDASGNITYAKLDPTNTAAPTLQLPGNGNGLIGGTGKLVNGVPDASVIVAANGGSDLLYVPSKDVNTVKTVVDFLTKQDYVSGVFVDDSYGNIPGALKLSDIGLKGLAQTPTPTIVVNFKTFSLLPASLTGTPLLNGVEIADSGLQEGQGMHGTFGRQDTFNNMAAIGPDFKKGYTDLAPVSNADVGTTVANLLGLNIPSVGNLKGRVISESLTGGPASVAFTSGLIKASDAAANGQKTYLNYQTVGTTPYYDAAGFAGATLGLKTA